jgi:hypothetical protein
MFEAYHAAVEWIEDADSTSAAEQARQQLEAESKAVAQGFPASWAR